MNKLMHVKGWAQALFSVTVLWSLINIMATYAGQVLDVKPLIFTCCAFASSAFVLLLRGGSGQLGTETFRAVDTWAFGLILLFDYIFLLGIFSLVTSTDGSILKRSSLIMGLLASRLFFSRKADNTQYLGLMLVAVSIVLIALQAPVEIRGSLYTLVFFSGLAEAGRVLVAETHRPHQAAAQIQDPKAKARVVGFVMFVLSGIFFTLTAVVAFLQSFTTGQMIPFVPALGDFMHSPSIVTGMITGVFLMAPVRMIEFNSSHLIKSENFLAIAAFSTLATLFWQWLLAPVLGIAPVTVQTINWLAVGLVTLGGVVIAIGKIRGAQKAPVQWREHLRYEPQNILAVNDSHVIVQQTLEHMGGNLARAAVGLGLPVSVLQALMADKQRVLAFKRLEDIERVYRQRVALADPLTGIANRAGVQLALQDMLAQKKPFAVVYIDLNHFKPINDQHGHDAGDRVLVEVSRRLVQHSPKGATVGRMGGDEFCIILKGGFKAAEGLRQTLARSIAAPIEFKGKKLKVTASLGQSLYPDQGNTPAKLLAAADKGMYSAKKSR